jgi:hypothetical protein
LVKLQIVEEDAKYFLIIETYLRIWQDNPDRFVAKRTEEDRDVFEHKVRLWRNPSPIPTVQHKKTEGNKKVSDSPDEANGASVDIASQRNLVFDFWQLTPSKRRKITQELGLLEPSDDDLTEPQRYRLAFQRARERNLIEKLEDVVIQTLTKRGE